MLVQSISTQLLLQPQYRDTASGINQNLERTKEVLDLANNVTGAATKSLGLALSPSYKPVYQFVAENSNENAVSGTSENGEVKTEDVFETRIIYGHRAIRETKVNSSRDLSGFDSLKDLGIEKGDKFLITVGDGQSALVKFKSNDKIEVQVDGQTQKFEFDQDDGSFRTGLQDALNSISGLTAAYSAEGQLTLKLADAKSLTLAHKGKAPSDPSDAPLAKLGLTAGTTSSSITRYERVQIGTEQVKVAEKAISVDTGTGYERKLVGLEQIESFQLNSTLHNANNANPNRLNHIQLLFGALPPEPVSQSEPLSLPQIRSVYAAF